MIKCCDEEMLISGDWYHCRKCSNRLIRCLHGEETAVLANMIVEHTSEYDPTWKELQFIFHELWKQGHYEEYEPDVPDNWNTSESTDTKIDTKKGHTKPRDESRGMTLLMDA